eukprot:Rhum_TRINITY_DN15453_c2_g1::Rhum_TRINITY_DN15453_c2_g1_i1::g.157507::m.157507
MNTDASFAPFVPTMCELCTAAKRKNAKKFVGRGSPCCRSSKKRTDMVSATAVGTGSLRMAVADCSVRFSVFSAFAYASSSRAPSSSTVSGTNDSAYRRVAFAYGCTTTRSVERGSSTFCAKSSTRGTTLRNGSDATSTATRIVSGRCTVVPERPTMRRNTTRLNSAVVANTTSTSGLRSMCRHAAFPAACASRTVAARSSTNANTVVWPETGAEAYSSPLLCASRITRRVFPACGVGLANVLPNFALNTGRATLSRSRQTDAFSSVWKGFRSRTCGQGPDTHTSNGVTAVAAAAAILRSCAARCEAVPRSRRSTFAMVKQHPPSSRLCDHRYSMSSTSSSGVPASHRRISCGCGMRPASCPEAAVARIGTRAASTSSVYTSATGRHSDSTAPTTAASTDACTLTCFTRCMAFPTTAATAAHAARNTPAAGPSSPSSSLAGDASPSKESSRARATSSTSTASPVRCATVSRSVSASLSSAAATQRASTARGTCARTGWRSRARGSVTFAHSSRSAFSTPITSARIARSTSAACDPSKLTSSCGVKRVSDLGCPDAWNALATSFSSQIRSMVRVKSCTSFRRSCGVLRRSACACAVPPPSSSSSSDKSSSPASVPT